MDIQKQTESTIRRCLHCGNQAPMRIGTTCEHSVEYRGDPPTSDADQDYYSWSLLICPACHRPTLEQAFKTTFEEDVDGWPTHTEILYPPSRAKITDLPAPVRVAYEAALRVQDVDANAFAVLIGRTLEVICKDRKAKGKDLFQKLEDLSARGEIPDRLKQIAQEIRLLRNIGAHADLGEVRRSEVPILIDLCEVILEYVYRAPFQLKMLQRRLARYNKKSS